VDTEGEVPGHPRSTTARPQGGAQADGHLEKFLSGAHSVNALFVFLNLLKGEPEGVGKLRLAHAKHHAPHAHSAADVNIDRVRAFGPASGHF